jgi:predicted ATP-grasp superfamily ATP-dependent carboligase
LSARSYLQEYVEGEARAALYAAAPEGTRLLGVTRQLVGEPWLHAAPFRYCGSVGPLPLGATERANLERLGDVLAAGCGLRGLFGVDGVWRDGAFWPVEVNPRYTASVEVIEHATGLAALAWHRRAFDPEAPVPPQPSAASAVSGKAILFAGASLTFPREGPWLDAAAFADIPDAGQRIEARRPILTLFACTTSVQACLEALQVKAAGLDGMFTSATSEPEA